MLVSVWVSKQEAQECRPAQAVATPVGVTVTSTHTPVYSSARAAITECHQPGGFNNRHYYLTVLEARSPDSRCRQGWFRLRL